MACNGDRLKVLLSHYAQHGAVAEETADAVLVAHFSLLVARHSESVMSLMAFCPASMT